MRGFLVVAMLLCGCADPARTGRTAAAAERWIPFPLAQAMVDGRWSTCPSKPEGRSRMVADEASGDKLPPTGRSALTEPAPQAPAEPGAESRPGGVADEAPRPPEAGAPVSPDATAGEPAPAPLSMPELPEFPGKVVAWNLFEHVAEAEIDTPRQGRLRTDDLVEAAYLHPFFKGTGNLAPLVQRVIASEFETQNFDMRDAVILPPPATLAVRAPDVPDATLSFSYCILGKAFQGDKSRGLSLSVTAGDGDAAVPLFSSEIDAEKEGDCTRWTEVSVPWPARSSGSGMLRFKVTSGKGPAQPRQGLAVANVVLLAPGGARTAPPVPGRAGGPNVVIFFIDAGRGDCTGPGNLTFPSVTPNLDRLAEIGVGFTNAFSISNQTRPSITGLLQAQHPTVGGFHARWWNLRPEVIAAYYASLPPLLPRMARLAGYVTASIGRNHFQYGTTRMGLDPGFDVVWDNRRAVEDTVNIIDRANAYVTENKDRKFLLEINISPTHQPYQPPEEYRARVDEILASTDPKKLPARVDYLGELYYADAELGRFIAAVKDAGIDDRTIILVTADHGETMHGSHSCNSELFKTICHNSHGLTLYDEEIHVPLVWSVPFLAGLVPGKRTNIVSHLDVVPTLLALMGLPEQPRALGRSLIPDLLGRSGPDEEIYVESRLASAVRIDGWKFILHHQKDDARTPAWLSGPENTPLELYDLRTDPFETRNLAGREKKRVDQLREALRRIRTGYADREKATRGTVWEPGVGGQGAGVGGGAGAAEDRTYRTNRTNRTNGAAPEPPQDGTATGAASDGTAPDGTAPLVPAEPSPKGPSSAPEAAPITASPPAHLYLALNHDRTPRHFRGRIHVDGLLLGADSLGANRCISAADPGGIDIDCTVDSSPFFLRLSVSEPDTHVKFDVQMDGAPLPASHLYVGRSGLALLGAPALADASDWTLAYSPRPPHFLAGFDAGLFAWHDRKPACAGGFGGPEDQDFEGQESINDGATRTVLKELGYWK